MFMRNVLGLVMAAFALVTLNLYDPNEKTTQIQNISSPVNMTDGNKPQHERIQNMTDGYKLQHEKVNPEEELSFKLTLSTSSGSLSYDTVFFLILIHMCGALISTLYQHMCWTWCFIVLALIVICAIMVAIFKWKRERVDLVKNNVQKEDDVVTVLMEEKVEFVKNNVLKDKQKEDAVTALMEVKAELENQRNQLKKHLKEVEADKEKNKQDHQSVEQDFDKPEELLRKKEHFLRTKWKLDQTKTDIRRQLLNTAKLMEPIEKWHRLKDEDVQN